MSRVNISAIRIKYFIVFVIILAIFGYKFTNTAAAQSTSTLSLSPSATTTTLGQTITFGLLINQVTDLWNAFFDLLYDRNILEFLTASDGGFLSSDATSVSALSATSTDSGYNDRLAFGITRLGGGLPGISTTSTSTIANLQFRTVGYGTSSLSFVDSIEATGIVDSNLDYIMSTWIGGTASVPDLVSPTTPSSFTASTTSMTEINLSWASSTDNDSVAAYYLYRDSTSTPTATTTGLTYQDTGLSASTTYIYFIKAVDAAGNSSGFATTSGTTLGDTTSPSIVILTPTSGATYNSSSTPITLTGTSTDDVAVTSVTWANGRGGSGSASGTTAWSVSGIVLQTGSNVISIVAHDGSGNTATDSVTIYLDTNAPTIPTSTASAVAASASQINLTWTAGSDTGVSGLAGYRIYRNSTTSAPITSVSTSWSDTGLSASTLYTYYIYSYDNALNQSASFASAAATTPAAPASSSGGGGGSFTPPDTTPPARPANFKAIPADGRITLSWVNPTDSDFSGVLILRTESLSAPVCPSAYNDSKAKEVYRGKAIEKVDIGLNNSLKYCYSIYSYDNIPNYAASVSLTAQPGAGQSTSIATSTAEITIVNNQTGTTSVSTSLADAPGSVVDAVSSDEAHQTFDPNQFVDMTAVTIGIYNKIMAQAGAGYNNQEKRALANFIQNGTANTRILGAGERGGSVGSFIAAFGRLPRSIADWQDVIKIGNGRWPKQTNLKAEAAAETIFKKIYLHAPKRATNKYEDNAIRIIAYGLRPAKRNMNSEAAAIKSFRYIFKRAPVKANDWDIVRAIAYSGAKR